MGKIYYESYSYYKIVVEKNVMIHYFWKIREVMFFLYD